MVGVVAAEMAPLAPLDPLPLLPLPLPRGIYGLKTGDWPVTPDRRELALPDPGKLLLVLGRPVGLAAENLTTKNYENYGDKRVLSEQN